MWFGVTSGTSGALVLVLEFSSAEAVVSAVSAAASSAVAAAAAGSAMCESVWVCVVDEVREAEGREGRTSDNEFSQARVGHCNPALSGDLTDEA